MLEDWHEWFFCSLLPREEKTRDQQPMGEKTLEIESLCLTTAASYGSKVHPVQNLQQLFFKSEAKISPPTVTRWEPWPDNMLSSSRDGLHFPLIHEPSQIHGSSLGASEAQSGWYTTGCLHGYIALHSKRPHQLMLRRWTPSGGGYVTVDWNKRLKWFNFKCLS